MNTTLPHVSISAAPSESSAPAADPALDDTGLSALRLLAPSGASARLAIVPRPGIAEISLGAPGRSKRMRVTFPAAGQLPFAASTLDGLIIDLDRMPSQRSRARELSSEIRRVLRPGGWCVAAVSHRRRARDRGALLRYRLVVPSHVWDDAFRSANLWPAAGTAMLWFDRDRLTRILSLDESGGGDAACATADAAAIVATAGPSASAPQNPTAASSVLGGITAALRRQLGDETAHIEQTLVRKIGKTACTVRAASGRRLLLRIPRSAVAERRAFTNFTALQLIHNGTPGTAIRELAPAPVCNGECDGYVFFAETMMPGRPRAVAVGHDLAWEPQALAVLLDMHRSSRRAVRFDERTFVERVAAPLDAIAPFVRRTTEQLVLERLRKKLWTDLADTETPSVSAHGDFTGENCLYDERGRLSAVIDWELFAPAGFPLLDLLQCMDVPGETRVRDRWLRAEIVLDAAEGRGPLAEAAVFHRYGEEMALSQRLTGALLLMYWVDHVAPRIAARSNDAAWMAKRVHAPLRRIAQMV